MQYVYDQAVSADKRDEVVFVIFEDERAAIFVESPSDKYADEYLPAVEEEREAVSSAHCGSYKGTKSKRQRVHFFEGNIRLVTFKHISYDYHRYAERQIDPLVRLETLEESYYDKGERYAMKNAE